MPEEEIQLDQTCTDALQRLADAKGLTPEDVLETIAVAALIEYPRESEQES